MSDDEIGDLADRLRGVESEDVFAIEWGALTEEERDAVLALIRQRTAHGEEALEAIEENVREAIGSGRIGLMEVIEAIRGAV
jgi:hypothetical protein